MALTNGVLVGSLIPSGDVNTGWYHSESMNSHGSDTVNSGQYQSPNAQERRSAPFTLQVPLPRQPSPSASSRTANPPISDYLKKVHGLTRKRNYRVRENARASPSEATHSFPLVRISNPAFPTQNSSQFFVSQDLALIQPGQTLSYGRSETTAVYPYNFTASLSPQEPTPSGQSTSYDRAKRRARKRAKMDLSDILNSASYGEVSRHVPIPLAQGYSGNTARLYAFFSHHLCLISHRNSPFLSTAYCVFNVEPHPLIPPGAKISTNMCSAGHHAHLQL